MKGNTMRGADFVSELEAAIQAVIGRNLETLDPWLEISPDKLLETCRWLKESCEIRFDGLQCITAVDWLRRIQKKQPR